MRKYSKGLKNKFKDLINEINNNNNINRRQFAEEKVLPFLFELLDEIVSNDGLEKIEETNTYVLYSNNKKCKKIFNAKVLSTCMAFRIDKTLIDVVISITNEYITIGIDYADDFISIPVESETNVQTLRRTKKDLELVTEIFDFVNENSK